MKKFILDELKTLLNEFRNLDIKVITIFLSIAILQTVSWYYLNPNFIKQNILLDFFSLKELTEFHSYIFWFIGDFFLFFILPILIIKFFFKQKIKSFGIQFGNKRVGIYFTIVSILILTPIIIIISTLIDNNSFSPFKDLIYENTNYFSLYVISLLIFLFAWEFIWRGFMLFGLEEKFGLYSIFIQMIPFVILHNGKPIIETFSSIFGAVFLGYLALRTRSIIYGFLIHAYLLFFLEIIFLLKN